MGELPSGTVTFLLAEAAGAEVAGAEGTRTDGPAATRAAPAQYALLFTEAVRRHPGVQVGPEDRRPDGADRRCAAFRSAHDAVTAAIALQRAVIAEPWSPHQPITVKIGIHTGED